MYVLGLSAYYHDSGAALLEDGEIVAAAQEERFTRRKYDASFPRLAAEYCLSEAGISLAEVGQVVFFEKPLAKFERIRHTFLGVAPKGAAALAAAHRGWRGGHH